jgi:hypothetical protein
MSNPIHACGGSLRQCRILVAFAVLVALSAMLAACGGSSSHNNNSSSNPEQILNEATLQGVKSGKIDIWGEFAVEAPQYDHIFYRISGPFQDKAGAELPEFDIRVRLNGGINHERIDVEDNLTLLPSGAYISHGGNAYKVDPATFGFVRSELEGLQAQSSEVVGGCKEAARDIEPTDFIDNLKNQGKEPVDGSNATRITGNLDVPSSIKTLSKLVEEPACSELLSSVGPLPSPSELEQAIGLTRNTLKRPAFVEATVDDDHLLRKFVVLLPKIDLPKQVSGDGGVESLAFALNFSLTDINEAQTIQAPQDAKPLKGEAEFLSCIENGTLPVSIWNCANLTQ